MLIPISKIKSSPKPIRSKWDEGAMEELKKSIAEQGLIVPIKVRPLDGEYEIVYGHRRVEAMRRLGWKECEAIVEGMESNGALIQSLIENVQREDLSTMDQARALREMKELTGWSNVKIGATLGKSDWWVGELLTFLGEPSDITKDLEVVGTKGPRRLDWDAVSELRRRFPDDEETKLKVAEKIRREGLVRDQLREVSRAVRAAPDERTREAILKTPFVKTTEQVLEEAEVEVIAERLEAKEEEEKERAWWREHPSSKEFLDLLKMYLRLIRRAWESVLKEKIPPEHCNYLAGFIEDKVIGLLQEIVTGLREKAKKWE